MLTWFGEGKRRAGRPRSIWKDNIKSDLEELGCKTWSEIISFKLRIGDWLL
jgi:hypothetical protein